MVRRIAAIVFIFVCTTVAWAILGATIFARSESAGSHLQGRVASNWGSPQTQVPPVATYVNTTTREEEVIENGKKLTRTITQNAEIALPVEASQIDVALNLDYR